MVQFFLERCVRRRLGRDHSGDVSQLGIHASGGHDGKAVPGDDKCSRKCHIHLFCHRKVFLVEGSGGFFYGICLSGQGGFLDGESHDRYDSRIGGNEISRFQDDKIPGNQK